MTYKPEFETPEKMFEQLDWCGYECEAGILKNNVAYIELKEWCKQTQSDLAALKEQTRWIPVEERLPVDNQPVLVNVKGYVYPKIGWHCHNVYTPQWSTSDDLYFHDISYGQVTHWQPLPTPPTSDVKEGE